MPNHEDNLEEKEPAETVEAVEAVEAAEPTETVDESQLLELAKSEGLIDLEPGAQDSEPGG